VSTDQPSGRARRVILLTCSLSLFIVSLDTSIVNVALPSIARNFHAQLDGLQWVVDAYILVLASLLMLSGSTGDRLGRRRIFKIGLVVFGVSSLACSLAPNLDTLIAFRALQGIGGSMLNPNSLSIVANVFTEPRERARAIGVWGAVFGISIAFGPILGGLLTDSIGWRAVFWVNVPVVAVAWLLTTRFVPESRAARARRIDPPGQLLAAILLGALCFGIVEGPADGWASAPIVAAFTTAAVALVAFVALEQRRDEPLLDLRFFRSPLLSGAALIAVLTFLVTAGFLFLNTLYLQDARGYSPLHAGLAILPASALLALVAPFSGRLVGWRGARVPMTAGGVFLAGGAALLASMTVTTSYGVLAGGYALLGLGGGLLNPPITNAAVSGLPNSQAGTASAIAATSRQIGSALGVAITGSIAHSGAALIAAHARGGVAEHTAAQARFALTTHPGWILCACCGCAISAVALATTGSWGRRRAAGTRAALSDGTNLR
jgi:EmrB/QacA subfamily drug resistance transporter